MLVPHGSLALPEVTVPCDPPGWHWVEVAVPGRTWQCRAPGQPQTDLEASGTDSGVAQAVPLPARGLGGIPACPGVLLPC